MASALALRSLSTERGNQFEAAPAPRSKKLSKTRLNVHVTYYCTVRYSVEYGTEVPYTNFTHVLVHRSEDESEVPTAYGILSVMP